MCKTSYILYFIFSLVIFSGCNAFSSAPNEKTQNQKDNDKYMEMISKNPDYKPLEFLNHTEYVYYKVIKNSSTPNGQKPFQNSEVRVILSGKLISGEVFQEEQKMNVILFDIDESGNPVGIVPGLRYALQEMTAGDKWEIVVPYTLGYGASYRGKISPYSTLIFTVEMLEIIKL